MEFILASGLVRLFVGWLNEKTDEKKFRQQTFRWLTKKKKVFRWFHYCLCPSRT